MLIVVPHVWYNIGIHFYIYVCTVADVKEKGPHYTLTALLASSSSSSLLFLCWYVHAPEGIVNERTNEEGGEGRMGEERERNLFPRFS